MSPRVLRRSFSTAAAALMLAFSAAGCASKDEPPVITPKPRPSTSALASDGGGDGAAASDGGGDSSAQPTEAGVDKSKIPPENRDLKAPDPKDYPGFYEKTDEGADSALRFYLDSLYYAGATGDMTSFDLVTNEGKCSGCDKARAGLKDAQEKGSSVSPLSWKEVESGTRVLEGIEYRFIVFDLAEGSVVTGPDAGQPVEGGRYISVANMDWNGKHWVIEDVTTKRFKN